MGLVSNIYLAFRYYLTRCFFWFLGLRVCKAEELVANTWALPIDQRNKTLNDCIKNNPHLSRRFIDGLDGISQLEVMSKERLKHDTKTNKVKHRFHRHTAGTTGEPTDIYLNAKELGQMLAVRAYCLDHYGIKLGDREARLWGRPESGLKSKIKNFVLNRRVFNSVSKNATNDMLEMENWQPTYLYGYSSLVLEAASIFSQSGRKIDSLKGIVCTAETILPAQKKLIEKTFGCPVIEEYGSTEFDIVVFECKDGHRHLVNPWLIVETVDDNIVITDVSRKTQALLRYNLGDSVRLSDSGCGLLGSNIILDAIDGRSINRIAFTKSGTPFHSVEFARAFESYMREHQETFKFRVVQQEAGHFILAVTPSPVTGDQHLIKYLEQKVKRATNLDINITLDHSVINSVAGVKNTYFVQLIDLD